MTSVIDNPGKVAEYIYSCKEMGIKLLPPDINKGYGNFSVDDGSIRYGLAAIKSIGKTSKLMISLLSGSETGCSRISGILRSVCPERILIRGRLKTLSSLGHLTVLTGQENST